MLTAITGYFDGTHIITEGSIILQKGQRVIITADIGEMPAGERVDLSRFMGCGEKLFPGNDAGACIKELRENDRI